MKIEDPRYSSLSVITVAYLREYVAEDVHRFVLIDNEAFSDEIWRGIPAFDEGYFIESCGSGGASG